MALTASSPPQEQPCPPGKQLRNQLAAAVRSINWTYAIFWSISSTHPGLLTWTDGFYNGEIKTRKIANNSGELTADQLALQRSEQLRELYESLQPARGCDPRPVAALSPDELGDTEWYYVVCMTYAFRPGQGLPGRCLTSNQHVWLCNAHLADSKTFPRALLAKSATIQTVVCIPLMGGVLELGATDSITEDQELVSRATTSFWELQFPAFTEEPCQCPSGNEVGDADDIDVFEDIAMETMIITGELEQGKDEILPCDSLQHVITNEIDDLYSLCEEMHVQPLEDEDWNMQGPNLETPYSQKKDVLGNTNNVAGSVNAPVDGITSCFVAWTRGTASDEATVPVVREPQRMLKKVVAGGVWENSGGGGNATRSTQESGIKNHVMSERRRREKLNEMFLVLKSIVPTIHKVDKASILAETIAYLKELQQRVQELESISRPEHITMRRPSGASRMRGHNSKSPKRRKASPELISVSDNTEKEQEHHWVLSKDGTSNVTVTVTDREVLLEVHCQWEELLMARVFDAIKALQLDLLSVQASTPNGFMGLKIHAQSSSSATIVPRMISEAVRKAIGKS